MAPETEPTHRLPHFAPHEPHEGHGVVAAIIVLLALATTFAIIAAIIVFGIGSEEPRAITRVELERHVTHGLVAINDDITTRVTCEDGVVLEDGDTVRCSADTLRGPIELTAVVAVDSIRYRIGFAIEGGYPPPPKVATHMDPAVPVP